MSAVMVASGIHGPIEAVPTDFVYLLSDEQPSVMLAVSHILNETFAVPKVSCVTTAGHDDLMKVCSGAFEKPVIAVIDPVSAPVELVRSIIAVNPGIRLLVYSACESPFLARSVVAAGAHGYVTKKSPLTNLIDGIGALVRGASYIEGRMSIERVSLHPWSKLTDSERTVLLAFADGQKAADIAHETGRSYSTVMTHKYNGLSKLGLRDGADLLRYVQEAGLAHELHSLKRWKDS